MQSTGTDDYQRPPALPPRFRKNLTILQSERAHRGQLSTYPGLSAILESSLQVGPYSARHEPGKDGINRQLVAMSLSAAEHKGPSSSKFDYAIYHTQTSSRKPSRTKVLSGSLPQDDRDKIIKSKTMSQRLHSLPSTLIGADTIWEVPRTRVSHQTLFKI